MDANMIRPTLTSVYMGRKAEPAKGKDGRAWEHHAWRLRLAHEGRERSFDPMAGLGRCEKRPAKPLGMPNDARLVYNAFWPGKDGLETPKAPTLFDALYCLCLDAKSYEHARSFEEWCSDFGMDDDSRTALGMYWACAVTARDLRRLLGRKLYDELTEMDEDALREWCAPTPSPAPEGVRS